MLQIISDSSSDLPAGLVKKYRIHLVPLTVNIDGEEYVEGITINGVNFAQKMAAAKTLPKTSQPSPIAFSRLFQELSSKGPLLCLTISAKLSGTYLSACQGQNLSGVDAAVFDTQAGSLGHGIQILKAAEMASRGLSLDEIIKELKKLRSEMSILILLNTLENIVKGGRLNRFSGTVAKILDIKVLLEGVEGAVELKEKIRGRKKFLQRVLEIISQRHNDFSDRIFGITHVNNIEDAEFFRKAIMERLHPKEILVNDMGPTMGTYAGNGGMIISF